MGQFEIRTALRKHIVALDPTFLTSRENAKFVPDATKPYQVLTVQPRAVSNPSFGDGFYRENGSFRINLCYPINAGEGAAIKKAEEIKNHFKRGTTLTEAGVAVRIDRTPSIGVGYIQGDRYVIPVRIEWYADLCA